MKKRRGLNKAERKERINQRLWYISRCIMGYNWARFFCFVGGRGAGKSTDIQRFLVKQWVEKGTVFTWLRLTDAEIKKLKQDNCKDAFEPVVVKEFPQLEDLKVKGDNLYCGDRLICRFKSLSTFQNDKGTALYDCNESGWSYILLDEMNRSSNAANRGDPVFQFANAIETLLRTKDQKIKVLMIGNLEGLSSMMAGCFNWIPLEGNFGIYKIRKHKAVIHYFDDSAAFKEKKKESTSSLINNEHSTFTNVLTFDKELLAPKVRLLKPVKEIRFKDNRYTVWLAQGDEFVVCDYHNEKCPKVTAMEQLLDTVYIAKEKKAIVDAYDLRMMKFRNLKTQEMFRQSLQMMKK